MQADVAAHLRGWVEYFRDLGVHDFYRRGEPVGSDEEVASAGVLVSVEAAAAATTEAAVQVGVPVVVSARAQVSVQTTAVQPLNESMATRLVSFDNLAPLPARQLPVGERTAALAAIRAGIGDCTRCPLAYAGRKTIVFGDGSPAARLMFVGEGPGADEDIQGVPFVGKAGQLLNNMITAMGLQRQDVYIANIVKCRPPGNRVPEAIEANTCSQFLLRQIDVIQPQVIVALGSTAATYLLGVRQSLSTLRGRWHSCRGAKLAVTYHPAFLLRDPRQKGEAWKDLQMVMGEMGLKQPERK